MNVRIIFIGIIVFSSCRDSFQKETDIDNPKENSISIEEYHLDETVDVETDYGYKMFIPNPTVDSLYKLLEKDLNGFGGYYLSPELPILLYISGHLFSQNESSTIILSCPNDSMYKIELFNFHRSDSSYWVKKDEIELKSHPLNFDIFLRDFNFDGFKDLYIQCSVSNGHSLSRGYLLIYDNNSEKLKYHPEASSLGNMNPNLESKTIHSEEIVYCPKTANTVVCKLFHHWINNELALKKKECPC